MITDAVEEAMKPAVPSEAELPYFVVREYPDVALRTKCAPFMDTVAGNARLQTLITVLEKTMDAYRAAGLAGPQVGIFFRIVAIRVDGRALTMINPVVTKTSNAQHVEPEGCLSFPGLFLKVKRYTAVEVRYTDRKGAEVTRWFYDLEAREAQHEIDHVDGKTFLDHIPKALRQGTLEKMRLGQRKQKAQTKQMEAFVTKLKADLKAQSKKPVEPQTLDYGTPMEQLAESK